MKFHVGGRKLNVTNFSPTLVSFSLVFFLSHFFSSLFLTFFPSPLGASSPPFLLPFSTFPLPAHLPPFLPPPSPMFSAFFFFTLFFFPSSHPFISSPILKKSHRLEKQNHTVFFWGKITSLFLKITEPFFFFFLTKKQHPFFEKNTPFFLHPRFFFTRLFFFASCPSISSLFVAFFHSNWFFPTHPPPLPRFSLPRFLSPTNFSTPCVSPPTPFFHHTFLSLFNPLVLFSFHTPFFFSLFTFLFLFLHPCCSLFTTFFTFHTLFSLFTQFLFHHFSLSPFPLSHFSMFFIFPVFFSILPTITLFL